MSRTVEPNLSTTRWDADALRAPHAQPDKAARVEAMFDAIAPTYERVNRLTSLGRDAAWRRRAVAAAAVRATDVVLDICCGTGDMIRAFADPPPDPDSPLQKGTGSEPTADNGPENRVPRGACTPLQRTPRLILGVDFAARMLEQGDFAIGSVPVGIIRADALRLPLADEAVDVISCAFGVRNFRDLQAGLDEMYRVARPAARLVILEFTTPESMFLRWAYRLYCERVLPRLATWVSRDRSGAYRYLPRSIHTFETAPAMVERLRAAGFDEVRLTRLNWGGVGLYRAVKPSRGAASGRSTERTGAI